MFFFELLYDNINLDHVFQDPLLEVIPKIISKDLNKILCCIPSDAKIKKVVFSFKGNKTLGPDGFPMFFQIFWDIVSRDLLEATKKLFGSRNQLEELNSTFLILIPKKLRASTFNGFTLSVSITLSTRFSPKYWP